MSQFRNTSDCLGPRASRRSVLQLGMWGAFTPISLGGLDGLVQRARASAAESSVKTTGRAKSVIMIFQWGGPSQLDTWDPKPEAPAEIRGEFGTIETAVPGIRISEHFPKLAKHTDKLAIIRSMTHDDPAHLSTVHHLLTGQLAPRPKSDAEPPSSKDWPFMGSMLAKVRPNTGPLPTSVMLPWVVSHPAAPGGKGPGQHGGWLGHGYDPFYILADPNDPGFQVPGLSLGDGCSIERMDHRMRLMDDLSRNLETESSNTWAPTHKKALNAVMSATAREAFDLNKETVATRDRYGRHIHGQCLLLARRMVEAGVPLVTVNWHNDGQNFWDTHGGNFHHLKNRLMPPADQGFAALLEDLEARGLLGDTLIVWTGEFGRTPRINPAVAGREHWPRCYSAVMAGGGIQGGQTYGTSDRFAAYPATLPTSPSDIVSTIFHALGIPHDLEIRDQLNRPLKISSGEPLTSLFG
jgi:hypothetical protein